MQRSAPGRRVRLGCLALALAFLPAAARAEHESWDAVYVGKSKVGHMHVWVEPIKDGEGKPLMRVRVDWEITFKRGKDAATSRQSYGTIETRDGHVLRLDTRTYASDNQIRTYGDVIDGKMDLTIESGGRSQHQVIDWPADVRGPYAAELSLAREPLQPGQSREVKTYIPDLNQVCLTRLKAIDRETVTLGGGVKRDLLKVEQVVTDLKGKPLPGMKSTLYVDGGGQIIKSVTDLLGGMVTYRTTKEGALSPSEGSFNLLSASIIKVPRPITNPERTRDVVYRVRLQGDRPAEVLPTDRRQSVKAQDGDGAVLEVKTAGPDTGSTGPAPDAEFLRSNPLVDSEDERVIKNAREAAAGKADPWAKAVAIQDWVHKHVKEKNFSTAFAPASEVARTLTGDCSEHSVLTAAMCRAVGVPARCVVGLVYASNLGGFGPHMWNEVYVNGRWVAIDAAFNQGEVDATHIKLSDTSLDGVAPFEALLPVIRVFDKMTIEPLEIR